VTFSVFLVHATGGIDYSKMLTNNRGMPQKWKLLNII